MEEQNICRGRCVNIVRVFDKRCATCCGRPEDGEGCPEYTLQRAAVDGKRDA